MKALPNARRLLVWMVALGAIYYLGGCDSAALMGPSETAEEQAQPADAKALFNAGTNGSSGPCPQEIDGSNCAALSGSEKTEIKNALDQYFKSTGDCGDILGHIKDQIDSGNVYSYDSGSKPAESIWGKGNPSGKEYSFIDEDIVDGGGQNAAEKTFHEGAHTESRTKSENYADTKTNNCNK